MAAAVLMCSGLAGGKGALARTPAWGDAQVVGQDMAQAPKKPALSPAQRQQKLAQWRAARDCAIFHDNRAARFKRQGDKAKAAEAELDWGDWDDVALDIEIELDMDAGETLAVEAKMEEAHQAQIGKSGWAGYEKAWAGKCREAP